MEFLKETEHQPKIEILNSQLYREFQSGRELHTTAVEYANTYLQRDKALLFLELGCKPGKCLVTLGGTKSEKGDGSLELAGRILSMYPDCINRRDECGFTPLIASVYYNLNETMTILFLRQGNVDVCAVKDEKNFLDFLLDTFNRPFSIAKDKDMSLLIEALKVVNQKELQRAFMSQKENDSPNCARKFMDLYHPHTVKIFTSFCNLFEIVPQDVRNLISQLISAEKRWWEAYEDVSEAKQNMFKKMLEAIVASDKDGCFTCGDLDIVPLVFIMTYSKAFKNPLILQNCLKILLSNYPEEQLKALVKCQEALQNLNYEILCVLTESLGNKDALRDILSMNNHETKDSSLYHKLPKQEESFILMILLPQQKKV